MLGDELRIYFILLFTSVNQFNLALVLFVTEIIKNLINMKKNSKPQKTVFNFLTPVKMKFKNSGKQIDLETKPPTLYTRMKSFSWFGSPTKSPQQVPLSHHQSDPTSIQSPCSNNLQFIKKLTNEHFLVGNAYRVDVMYLGGIIEDFIDIEYIWSLDFNRAIMNVAVDIKKCILAFLFLGSIQIYQYNLKKSKEKPILFTTITTSGHVKFIQFAKQSYLTLFYEKNIQIFYIDDNFKVAKKKFSKHYNQPIGANIFQVPQAFQGVINIFFTQPKVGTSMFHLWNLQLKLQKQQITMGTFLKIYDISNGLRDKIVLSNYSKEIFCMNLGHQILAVKKGYIIDTVNSNIDNDHAVLRYLGNDRLIHVLTHKVQLYRFSLNMQLNPPRIILQSTDSIWSKINCQKYAFIEVLQMLNDNIVVFYQITQQNNKSLSGQIIYAINVTQKVKFEDKIKDILPSSQELQKFKNNNPNNKISDQDYQLIEEKVDMAMKMGLTRREIYLKLWNNSKKQDIADYQFLLDTMDYNTIRAEIQNKLKKKSMVLRQVIKIEEGCISMLQTKVFSPEVNIEYLKNFLISHFLLRKLKLYQMFFLIEKQQQKLKRLKSFIQEGQKQESQAIMINIKDYMRFAKCELKSLLLELIRQLPANKTQAVLKIRTLVKLFKFSFRPIYSNLLQSIIQQAGDNILVLIEQIPEFLPYEHILDQQSDYTLYEGVWGNILPEEWDSNLYVGGISTIDNKEIVEEIKNSVWAKRYFLSLHDLLPYQKAEILQIHERNKAEQTFYNFIERIFHCVKQQSVLTSLINLIQTNYQKLPKHLVGQIFIYKALYDFLKSQNALMNKLEKGQFNEFLKLKDFEIFKLIFDLEKRKKNCILKDVKQGIYNQQEYVADGSDLFNMALLNFFSSQLSQISDIKYLLNRLNNQKYEFHSQNQGMYQVIVKGMQAKLYLGSDHDIPINQVYIYISNIHIDPNSEIKKDLNYLKIINKHAEKLKKVKLNMNVFQIIRQMERMLRVIVNYQVEQREIYKKTDPKQILSESIMILDQVQRIKDDIYNSSQTNKNLVFFIYLTRILQHQSFIPQAILLLHSPIILTRYVINQIFIQNIVIYMYKKQFSKQKIYKYNESYINELLKLLNDDNQTRQFISNQIELGITLSCGENLLEYPIGGANAILSTVELEAAIGQLSADRIGEINFERIFRISLRIQQISSDGQISSITMYQIYEIVILRLLQCNAIRDAITYMRKIIQFNPLNPYNFIYPVLLMKKFTSELCDQNRFILLKILTYQFENSQQLLDIAEKLLSIKCTSLEQKIILKNYLRKVQGENNTYDKRNPIFDQDYIQGLVSKVEQKRFAEILSKTFQKIIKVKDQFSQKPQYAIIFTILLNNPYGIVKYLYCSKYQSNFKGIRCFFSYLCKQQVFNKIYLLQLGKRIFKILHEGLSQTVYIEQIIDKYQSIGLNENLQIEKIKPLSNLSIVMSKAIERFKNKLKEELTNKKDSKLQQQTISQRRQRIRKRLSNESTSNELIPTQYPFQDSDNQLTGIQPKLKPLITNEKTQIDFDPIFQQQLLLTRQHKNLALYLSQQRTTSQKELFYSKKQQQLQLRNSVAKLKHKKKQLEDEFNLKLSLRRSMKYGMVLSDIVKKQNQEFRNSLKKVKSINLGDITVIPHSQNNRALKTQAKSMFLPQIRNDLTEVKQIQKKNQIKILSPKAEQLQYQTKYKDQEQEQVNTSVKEINRIIKQERSNVAENERREMDAKEDAREECEAIRINFDDLIDQILSNNGDDFTLTPILSREMSPDELKSFIITLYNSPSLTPSQSMAIIQALSLTQIPVRIIKENLQVYIRMQSFQKRFTLEMDLKQMLPIQGVFIQCNKIEQLFKYFKRNIVSILKQSNVYKITKVVSLAFKNNDIQQQLNVEFLVKWLKQLEDNPIRDQKDLSRQKEKIRAFTEKISIQKLNAKGGEILTSISDCEFRNQLIQTIVQAMRKKKNDEMALSFANKWQSYTQ